MNEEKLETLLTYVEDAEKIVFFGGAGVSTESGVPDFRSKDGLYNQHDVRFEPNNAHKYLAKLEEKGKLTAVVTQNIDGLHQKAGSKKVYEIHGSALRNYCIKCGKTFPEDYIFESKESIPHCDCGGMIRPDITLYEESLPDDAVNASINAIADADMLIIGGTSLTVYPAASYIDFFSGKYLVIINRDALDVRSKANTLLIQDKIGEVFTELAKKQGISL